MRQSAIESLSADETLLEKRIADLERQIQELKTALSGGYSSNLSTDAVDAVQLQMTDWQAEMPEDLIDAQARQLGQPEQDWEATDQMNQPVLSTTITDGIDSFIMYINYIIDQLNEDLYRDFP